MSHLRQELRSVPGARGRAAVLVLAVAAGALGLLPAAGGAGSAAMLAWLALLAPAAGYACGAAGLRLLPYGLSVPALWGTLLLAAELGTARPVATPLFAMAAVAGLFGLGAGAGARLGRPAAGAGVALLVALLASGGAVQGGLSRGGSWGAHSPGLARSLLELSPLVLVLECAGLDWTHAHPDVYRLSGIEWFPRRPHRGPLAGPAVLVLGCLVGSVLGRRSRPAPPRGPASGT